MLVLWIGFAAFMVIKGREVIEFVIRSKQRTPALRISMAIPYLSVPVGCTLMGFRIVQQFIKSVPNWKERWAK